MIRRIIEFSARNRLAVIVAVAAAAAFAFVTLRRIPLDAIPDLSDTQVIVYSRWDRSPDLIEDQVTYPIVTALLGTPKVKAVRGFSDFGFSYVYVVFQDGTDIYWARSRVVELLSKVEDSLPAGVRPEIGPDATGVGWVFQYALRDRTGSHTAAELRSLQDFHLKYALRSVPGVAEVATVGGFEKQYQVTVDPVRLQALGLSLIELGDAIRKSNGETGGRLVEWNGREYMVRGRGYVASTSDLAKVVVRVSERGVPLLLRDVATIELGPQLRRGLADLDGEGETVGGIVVMRQGENALAVIGRVRAKLAEFQRSLPLGVELVTTYDRSELIKRSISNLTEALALEMLIVSLVILFFLWHFPSAFVPILTIPVAVLLSFVPMAGLGITSNIMSLAGIAISIGVLVDGAIVEMENAYKRLEAWQEAGRPGDFHQVRLNAMLEVGPSVFFSLLVIAVAFLPVFALVDQEGRLFRPLATTKTLTMAMAAILVVTLDPAVRMAFTRVDPFRFRPRLLARVASTLLVGRYQPEDKHPVSRVLFRLYDPPCRWVLRHPKRVIGAAVLAVLAAIPVYLGLGSEFMPPLDEGSILYMPTTMPGISVTEAHRLLTLQDRILRRFPEVESVFGKAGRADTATDPAPFSMMETTVLLKPHEQWREKSRWYSGWAPRPLKAVLRTAWPDHISSEELIAEMDAAMQIPGNSNAWTMPIRGRIDMLSTGVRTPVGIKVLGSDLAAIEGVAVAVERVLKGVPGTRSAFAERAAGGYFVDFVPDRDGLARWGLSVEDLQAVLQTALGGETITTTVEGRERYTVNLRYVRDQRSDLERLDRILVPSPGGAQVPIQEVATISLASGPSMVRDENGMLAAYVYADVAGRDIGSYITDARAAVAAGVPLPTGTALVWSGQWENMVRVRERLKLVLPITLVLIVVLLIANTRSATKAGIVLLAVPFSLVGAVALMAILGYNVSVAAWVGMIALMGLDAETGVFMLLFLDLSYEEARKTGRLTNDAELQEAIVHGAVKRLRPKLMTVAASFLGLMPIMWSAGTGADMMKRVAAPMAGGLFTSFLLELLVYPPIYLLWKRFESRRASAKPA
ncbi:MAG: efflux RND transporter permease subunit [Acidobacteriia bacterium]|nr:efflux RND transporter permease subunit [Terriglobia bacterium]